METHKAEMDFGMVADGARGTIIIMMIAIETVIHTAIGVPETETGNLAKAISERYPVQRHGVMIAPGLLEPPINGSEEAVGSVKGSNNI